MLLKKRKHLEMRQLLFASVAVKARRAAVNLMNGDAYAESTSVTAEQTSAFNYADHVQVQRGGCYVGRPTFELHKRRPAGTTFLYWLNGLFVFWRLAQAQSLILEEQANLGW